MSQYQYEYGIIKASGSSQTPAIYSELSLTLFAISILFIFITIQTKHVCIKLLFIATFPSGTARPTNGYIPKRCTNTAFYYYLRFLPFVRRMLHSMFFKSVPRF